MLPRMHVLDERHGSEFDQNFLEEMRLGKPPGKKRKRPAKIIIITQGFTIKCLYLVAGVDLLPRPGYSGSGPCNGKD